MLKRCQVGNSVRFSHLLTNNNSNKNNSINLKAKENKKMKLLGGDDEKKNIERMRKSMKIYLNFFFFFFSYSICVLCGTFPILYDSLEFYLILCEFKSNFSPKKAEVAADTR